MGFLRMAIEIAHKFYGRLPDYLNGDAELIRDMSRNWKVMAAALEMDEHQTPMSARDYVQIEYGES